MIGASAREIGDAHGKISWRSHDDRHRARLTQLKTTDTVCCDRSGSLDGHCGIHDWLPRRTSDDGAAYDRFALCCGGTLGRSNSNNHKRQQNEKTTRSDTVNPSSHHILPSTLLKEARLMDGRTDPARITTRARGRSTTTELDWENGWRPGFQCTLSVVAESRPQNPWVGLLTRKERIATLPTRRPLHLPRLLDRVAIEATRLHSQWRDRAGFAPASLLCPRGHPRRKRDPSTATLPSTLAIDEHVQPSGQRMAPHRGFHAVDVLDRARAQHLRRSAVCPDRTVPSSTNI